MSPGSARQTATIAGLVTGPTGVALLVAPRIAGAAGLTAAQSRAIGAVDLALAPGLLAGRPRWPWAAARAAANVATHGGAHAPGRGPVARRWGTHAR